ncbi:unnamed protein product [Soboliphyme baturini]|uniref:LRRNT domain-containing protein n=1 Tax=Soboliphyme baturini TaxID=241478 RepID=A0A183J1Y2_9BILA|nr:unnamed protein product [Soboliphyme baturini]
MKWTLFRRLADNHLVCDCRLTWLARWLNRHPRLGLNTRCQAPVFLRGRNLAEVDEDELQCSGIENHLETGCQRLSVCPPMCACTESTIDCRDRSLTQVPPNLPDTTSELYVSCFYTFYDAYAEFCISVETGAKPDFLFALKSIFESEEHETTVMTLATTPSVKSPRMLLKAWNLSVHCTKCVFFCFSVFFVILWLYNLQLLLLNANKLQCIRKETFSALSNLNLLSLYDNQIKSLADGTFADLIHLQTL